MEKLLDWILENSYGYVSITKFRWGGQFMGYSISFHTLTMSRGNQHMYREYYGEIAAEMSLNDAVEKALEKLKNGWLDKIGGDLIDNKRGARYIDGNQFIGQMYVKNDN